MQSAQGDSKTALGSYQAALAIRKRLTATNPGNSGSERFNKAIKEAAEVKYFIGAFFLGISDGRP